MRPISHGFYKLFDLYDGSVNLEMVARANDTLDLEAENERRYAEALERKNKR